MLFSQQTHKSHKALLCFVLVLSLTQKYQPEIQQSTSGVSQWLVTESCGQSTLSQAVA